MLAHVVSFAGLGERFAGSVMHAFGRCFRTGRRFNTEASQRFFRFFLPLRAAEMLRGGGVPFRGLVRAAALFFDDAELPGDHGITRALIQLRKLRQRVGAGLRLANASLNLAPVAHGGALYQRYVVEAKQRKDFFRRGAGGSTFPGAVCAEARGKA